MVTCQFGMFLMPEHCAAMREAVRVLRPGGLLAASMQTAKQQVAEVLAAHRIPCCHLEVRAHSAMQAAIHARTLFLQGSALLSPTWCEPSSMRRWRLFNALWYVLPQLFVETCKQLKVDPPPPQTATSKCESVTPARWIDLAGSRLE